MHEHGRGGGSAAGTGGLRGRRLPWRGVVIALALVAGWMLPSSVSGAQANGRDARSRVCSRLESLQARVADHPSARQALASRLQRFGCTTSGPTTTSVPGPFPTTTVVPGTFPPTTAVTTTLPPGATTTTVPVGGTTSSVFVPTTAPPGAPTTLSPSTSLVPPPSLPQCSSTTTATGPVVTTVPCVP